MANASRRRRSRLHADDFFARLAKGARNDAGMAAVEFSLILPILVLLWIGGVEVTQALSVDRRLNNLSSSIGDLVARSKIVTYNDVDSIFDIAPGAMYPYSATATKMRVTAVDMDGGNPANGKVAWSRAEGITAYADNQSMNTIVPQTLRVANTQVIVAEVYAPYTPAIGKVITGTLNLTDRMFFVPRLVTKVQLCDNAKANCKS
jgi:Flp pilus assembly protein TadG